MISLRPQAGLTKRLFRLGLFLCTEIALMLVLAVVTKTTIDRWLTIFICGIPILALIMTSPFRIFPPDYYKCSKCDATVSRRTRTCPNCGIFLSDVEVRAFENRRWQFRLLLLVLGVPLTYLFYKAFMLFHPFAQLFGCHEYDLDWPFNLYSGGLAVFIVWVVDYLLYGWLEIRWKRSAVDSK